MRSKIKGLLFLAIITFASSCGGSKNKNPKPEYKQNPIATQFDHVDCDGVRWSNDNLFAPRSNESINDPNYKKRNENLKREVDPYDKGYKEGYNDARRKYDSN